MGKIRRGGYIFVTWIGDHAPRHVHVYKDGNFVVKWDLENHRLMKGKPTKRMTIRQKVFFGAQVIDAPWWASSPATT